MIKPSAFFTFVFLFVMIVSVFQVAQKVQLLRNDLVETNRQLKSNLDELHVLRAEWTYLTQPKRLERISRKYLRTKNISVAQIKDIDVIPMQPFIVAEKNN